MLQVSSLKFYVDGVFVCACRKVRRKEASKLHAQLCIALFCMFFFFLVGIDRTNSEVGCTICSILIQYFTMASVALMGAEAVLMFHRLIIVFGHTHFLILSIIAWGKYVGKIALKCYNNYYVGKLALVAI